MTGWWTDSADLVNILIIVDWTQIFWVYIKLLSNQITIFSNQITIFSNQIDKYSWWKKQTNKQTNDSPMNRLQLAGCRLKSPTNLTFENGCQILQKKVSRKLY